MKNIHTSLSPVHYVTQKQRHLKQSEAGSAVLETVIIIAVILAVALLFNSQLRAFADRLFTTVFNNKSIFDVLG